MRDYGRHQDSEQDEERELDRGPEFALESFSMIPSSEMSWTLSVCVERDIVAIIA